MGAFKEAACGWQPGGQGWADVSPSRRCPVCDGSSWCQVARDGLTVLCKRIGNGARPKVNGAGVDYYVHHHGARAWTPPPAAPLPTTARASADDYDRAYRAALAALRLDDCDREGLRALGVQARKDVLQLDWARIIEAIESEYAAAAGISIPG